MPFCRRQNQNFLIVKINWKLSGGLWDLIKVRFDQRLVWPFLSPIFYPFFNKCALFIWLPFVKCHWIFDTLREFFFLVCVVRGKRVQTMGTWKTPGTSVFFNLLSWVSVPSAPSLWRETGGHDKDEMCCGPKESEWIAIKTISGKKRNDVFSLSSTVKRLYEP